MQRLIHQSFLETYLHTVQSLEHQPGLLEWKHSHERRWRITLLSDIIQDDMGILHLFPFTLPLCHIAFQTKDHRRGWGKKTKSQYKTVPHPPEALVPEQIRGTMAALLGNIPVVQISHVPSRHCPGATSGLCQKAWSCDSHEDRGEHRAPAKEIRVAEVLPHRGEAK